MEIIQDFPKNFSFGTPERLSQVPNIEASGKSSGSAILIVLLLALIVVGIVLFMSNDKDETTEQL